MHLCIGKRNADEIFDAFGPRHAAKILLHLHTIFDHVISHGFGSDLAIREDSPEGRDYQASRTGVVGRIERVLCEDLRVLFPEKRDEWFSSLLQEEHFLRDFSFDSVTPNSFEDVRERLDNQFRTFRRKVGRLDKVQKLLEKTFTLSFLAPGIADIAESQIVSGFIKAAVGGGASSLSKIPKSLSETIVNVIRRLYTHNLGSYLIRKK